MNTTTGKEQRYHRSYYLSQSPFELTINEMIERDSQRDTPKDTRTDEEILYGDDPQRDEWMERNHRRAA